MNNAPIMQYIHVKLLNGFTQSLTYAVPPSLQTNLIGSIVKVPLKERLVWAYVIAQTDTLPVSVSFTIKTMHSLEPFPNDDIYKQFLAQLAYYYAVTPMHFIKRIAAFIMQKEQDELLLTMPTQTKTCNAVSLTQEQQNIVDAVEPSLAGGIFTPTLIHGVTGSGKTEIYKQLILKTIAHGKSIILLLPEVSLALHFEHILKATIGDQVTIMSFHSATKAKEKKMLWQMLLAQKPLLIIGVHIPIILPIAQLGLIIIDEEHETGYQEKKHPKINTKEAALLRAQLYKIPIILGSATPSIATLHTAKTKGWQIFNLHKRFAGKFPEIQIALLTNKERRSNFWITQRLHAAIVDRLAKKEQIILFLNRRGYSFFVQCKECSFIFECSACSVSLTLHENNQLTCHYCGYTQHLPTQCSSCKKNDLLKKGIGTQQVVTIIQQLFPHARIGRADLDVTSKKKLWQETMSSFTQGNLDILIGTQTITKGFHFPNVTLVGILWADLNLHFPMYNAAETSLQQLIQVAGRAGRERPDSTVIIQTMMNHPIFNYVHEIDYLKFYEYELRNRSLVQYPPLIRLVEIELKNTQENILENDANALATNLMRNIVHNKLEITLLGPAKPPVSKIKNTYARKIYLKSNSLNALIAVFKSIDQSQFSSAIFFTPNPSN